MQIGHVLGLKHESVGVYGYQMFGGDSITAKVRVSTLYWRPRSSCKFAPQNPAGNIRGWEEKYRSTIYDVGSVMDQAIMYVGQR